MKNRFRNSVSVLIITIILSGLLSSCSDIGRISKDLTSYSIDAAYFPGKHTIEASVHISYINSYDVPLNSVSFHLYGNAYRRGAAITPISYYTSDKAYPNGASYGSMQVTSLKLNGKTAPIYVEGQDKDILTVMFDTALYPTARYEIDIKYTLTLANVLHRLGYNDNTVNLGNWYPVACIYSNGAFLKDPYYSNGDPFYTHLANYKVSLTVDSSYVIASTGTLEDEIADGTKTKHVFSAEAVRDFAMVLSKEFKVMSVKHKNTEIKYYYYRDLNPGNSLKACSDSLKTFNDMIGEYPYDVLSVVETGFNHGGMEYPKLVYISDTLSRESYIETIVHEIAHQWWYAVVGNDQVRHSWLDEGLTEYTTTLFYEKNPDYEQTRQDRITQTLQTYVLYVDLYNSVTGVLNTAMDRPCNEFMTETEYVCMTYIKGELMFDTLRNTIGDNAFFKALGKYYMENRFKTATPAILKGSFERACGYSLENFFGAWLNGSVYITASGR